MKRVHTAMLLAAAVAMSPSCKKDKEGGEAQPEPAEAVEPEQPAEPETPDEPEEEQANLTDLGLSNQQNPAEHVVTGGQITEEQIAKAKEAGVTTIVNVRAEAEKEEYANEQEQVEAAGMTYVHMPIDAKTGDGLNEENAKKLSELIEKGEPMVVHCKSGQRVGALFAVKAAKVDGKPVEEAMAEGEAAGMTSPDLQKVTQNVLEKKK